MKKYFLIGLIVAIAPNLCLGASARYTQLVREKQRKIEELEKCMGATKGLKIAGISTLGLTAVGVAGNIAEAQKRDSYETDMKSLDKKITKLDGEITEETEKREAIKRKAELREEVIDITDKEIQKTIESDKFQEYLDTLNDEEPIDIDGEIELVEEIPDDEDAALLQYECEHVYDGTKWVNGTCVCEKKNQILQGNKCVDEPKK